jgi:hypothetical protein
MGVLYPSTHVRKIEEVARLWRQLSRSATLGRNGGDFCGKVTQDLVGLGESPQTLEIE